MRLRHALPVIAAFLMISDAAATECTNPSGGLGVARVVEIDATGGPVFGFITKQPREARFLAPKEVVLTFDDGPLPVVTRAILDTLDRFCTKATFFSVGRMAVAYPDSVREIMRRGHTLGTHTWSHPMSLPRLKGEQARDQIESGFAAVAMAAGQPIAPFFRFPGLNDSQALISHLEARGIATFTVDVVSNDSYIHDPGRLIERTLAQLQIENGGIMLFHDIKPQTARALPTILAEMKARGYKVVHMRSKAAFKPDARYQDAVRQHVAQKTPNVMRALTSITETPAAPSPEPVTAPTVTVAAVPDPVVQPRAAEPAAPAKVESPNAPVTVEAVAAVAPAALDSAAAAIAATLAGIPQASVMPEIARPAAAQPKVEPVAPAAGGPAAALASAPAPAAPAPWPQAAVAPLPGTAAPPATDAAVAPKAVRPRRAQIVNAPAAPPLVQETKPVQVTVPVAAAASSPAPAIEVVAGSYKGGTTGAPLQLPQVMAGNYPAQRALPPPAATQPLSPPKRANEKPWHESFSDRTRETGN